jgi:hypothetical protein
MVSQKLQAFRRWTSVAVLFPAFLTLGGAVQAQNSTANNKLSSALGIANAKVTKSSFNFNQMVTTTQQASTITPSATLPKFIDHRDYVAADAPANLAMGDLNGDGIPDLVIPNFNSREVSVLLGNHDGSFRTLRLFDSGGVGPFDAVVADFNGDAKKDVAVTIPTVGIAILLGDGLGHLGVPRLIAAGVHPTHIVATDFNGDHKIDLAITNLGSNNVSIFLGKGDGTFTRSSLAVGMGPVGLAVEDFNHDGKIDVAVANSGETLGGNLAAHANTVAILLGNGSGSFQAATFIPVAKTPLVVAVGDFNKDTKQDLVVSSNSGFVSELLGNGNGTFQTPRQFSVPQADSISLADFNSDGNTDLVVTDADLSDIALLLGDGTGNFKPRAKAPSGRFPAAVLAGDFNHDGKADYITANLDPNTVSVVLGKGNGTFFDIGPDVPTNGAFSNQIISADFNNDGIPDLAQVNTGVIGQIGNSVSILLGKNGGGFQPGKAFPAGASPDGLAAGDFNNDGHLDLAVAIVGDRANDIFPSLAVLLGNGDGTFGAPHQFAVGGSPTSVAVADFNGDGNLDAVVAQDGLSFSDGSVSVRLGNGKGSFAQPKPIVLFGTGHVSTVVTADFNHDGKMDIAYLSITDQNRVTVQVGNGNGTFQAPKVVTSAGFTTLFSTYAIGDFNNDGILDFAVEEFGFLETLLGDGQGNFTSKGAFFEGIGSTFPFVPSLVLADFNGDGLLDVGVPDGFGETVSMLLGNGNGTLRPAQLFGGGLADSAVAIDAAGFQPAIAMATHDAKVRIIKNATPSAP